MLVSRVPLARKTLLAIKADSALVAGQSRVVLLAHADILRHVLMLSIGRNDVSERSLAVAVLVAAIVTQFILNAFSEVEDWPRVDFFHDFFFHETLMLWLVLYAMNQRTLG